jgi:hypothetical protein
LEHVRDFVSEGSDNGRNAEATCPLNGFGHGELASLADNNRIINEIFACFKILKTSVSVLYFNLECNQFLSETYACN